MRIDHENLLVVLMLVRRLCDVSAGYKQKYPDGCMPPTTEAAQKDRARDFQDVVTARWRLLAYTDRLEPQVACELLCILRCGQGLCAPEDLLHAQQIFAQFRQPAPITFAMLECPTLADDFERGLALVAQSGVLRMPTGRD